MSHQRALSIRGDQQLGGQLGIDLVKLEGEVVLDVERDIVLLHLVAPGRAIGGGAPGLEPGRAPLVDRPGVPLAPAKQLGLVDEPVEAEVAVGRDLGHPLAEGARSAQRPHAGPPLDQREEDPAVALIKDRPPPANPLGDLPPEPAHDLGQLRVVGVLGHERLDLRAIHGPRLSDRPRRCGLAVRYSDSERAAGRFSSGIPDARTPGRCSFAGLPAARCLLCPPA